MNIEQLTAHIELITKMELEYRARALETRKMRADLIEEQIAEVPESEREAFRQALLTGKTKSGRKTKEPKEKKETDAQKVTRIALEVVKAGTPLAMAKVVAQWMVKTGKTREQVEAMFND